MMHTVARFNLERPTAQSSQIREIEQNGRWLTIRVQEDGVGVILSILSSDPRDYLNPELQPGAPVRLADYGLS